MLSLDLCFCFPLCSDAFTRSMFLLSSVLMLSLDLCFCFPLCSDAFPRAVFLLSSVFSLSHHQIHNFRQVLSM